MNGTGAVTSCQQAGDRRGHYEQSQVRPPLHAAVQDTQRSAFAILKGTAAADNAGHSKQIHPYTHILSIISSYTT